MKGIKFLLVACALFLVFAACGNGQNQNEKENENKKANSVPPAYRGYNPHAHRSVRP